VTTVYLARHGAHDELGRVLSGRSEIPLNDAGLQEAERLAAALAMVPLRAIHSSPRRRARETAEPMALRVGKSVSIVEALDEIDFGAWSGKRFDALDGDADWNAWNAHRWQAPTPAGETMTAVVARAAAHIEAIVDGPVLCVSHCDVIRGLIAHYRQLPDDAFFSIDIDPGSLSRIDFIDGTAHVVTVNARP
jgi:ribonuclease H / adenosylcobalamin/alpha-ribazole phosphatase